MLWVGQFGLDLSLQQQMSITLGSRTCIMRLLQIDLTKVDFLTPMPPSWDTKSKAYISFISLHKQQTCSWFCCGGRGSWGCVSNKMSSKAPRPPSLSLSLKGIDSCNGATAAGNWIKYLQSSKNEGYALTLTTRTLWRRSLILEHMRGVNSTQREKTCLSFTSTGNCSGAS